MALASTGIQKAKLGDLLCFAHQHLQHWAVFENRVMVDSELPHKESPICVHGCEIKLWESIARKRRTYSSQRQNIVRAVERDCSQQLVVTGINHLDWAHPKSLAATRMRVPPWHKAKLCPNNHLIAWTDVKHTKLPDKDQIRLLPEKELLIYRYIPIAGNYAFGLPNKCLLQPPMSHFSRFSGFLTKVNSVWISAKCQHVFIEPTSCSDNLNFPYELLLDEHKISPRLAVNAENRWPFDTGGAILARTYGADDNRYSGYRCLP